MTPTAGWTGLVAGTGAAITVWVLSEDVTGTIGIGGQGGAFVAAGAAFVVDILVSVAVTLVTRPKAESELRGLVWSLTPKKDFHDPDEPALSWYQRPTTLAGIGLVMVVALNFLFA
jgi:SSS family solute:Na+ symporter